MWNEALVQSRIEQINSNRESHSSMWDREIEAKINELNTFLEKPWISDETRASLEEWIWYFENLRAEKNMWAEMLISSSRERRESLLNEIECQRLFESSKRTVYNEVCDRIIWRNPNQYEKFRIDAYFNDYFCREITNYYTNPEDFNYSIIDFCEWYSDVFESIYIPKDMDEVYRAIDDWVDNELSRYTESINNEYWVGDSDKDVEQKAEINTDNIKYIVSQSSQWIRQQWTLNKEEFLWHSIVNNWDMESSNLNQKNTNLDRMLASTSESIRDKLSSKLTVWENWELTLSETVYFWWGRYIELSQDGKSFKLVWFDYNFSFDNHIDNFYKVINKIDSLEFLENSWLFALWWWNLDTCFSLLSRLNTSIDFNIHKDQGLTNRERRELLKTFAWLWVLWWSNSIEPDLQNVNKRIVDGEAKAINMFNTTEFYDSWVFHYQVFEPIAKNYFENIT